MKAKIKSMFRVLFKVLKIGCLTAILLPILTLLIIFVYVKLDWAIHFGNLEQNAIYKKIDLLREQNAGEVNPQEVIGEWDKICLIGPYPQKEDIDKLVGFNWKGSKHFANYMWPDREFDISPVYMEELANVAILRVRNDKKEVLPLIIPCENVKSIEVCHKNEDCYIPCSFSDNDDSNDVGFTKQDDLKFIFKNNKLGFNLVKERINYD